MAANLKSRLAQLEAGKHTGPGGSDPRFAAAVSALIRAAGGPAGITAMATRFQEGCATDADRAALAQLPSCDLAPAEVLQILARVRNEM